MAYPQLDLSAIWRKTLSWRPSGSLINAPRPLRQVSSGVAKRQSVVPECAMQSQNCVAAGCSLHGPPIIRRRQWSQAPKARLANNVRTPSAAWGASLWILINCCESHDPNSLQVCRTLTHVGTAHPADLCGPFKPRLAARPSHGLGLKTAPARGMSERSIRASEDRIDS